MKSDHSFTTHIFELGKGAQIELRGTVVSYRYFDGMAQEFMIVDITNTQLGKVLLDVMEGEK